MAQTYIKRGAVVQAEAFDPSRTDQGVSVWEDELGEFSHATMATAGGRTLNVRPGDMIVTGDFGIFPCAVENFGAMFAPVAEALPQASIVQTGGNQ